MKTISHILKNNDGGMVIIMVMLLVTLLSIISIAASKTSNTEVAIAGNDYAYMRIFYTAEGTSMEAVGILEALEDPKKTPPGWLEERVKLLEDNNVDVYWAEIPSPSGDRAVPDASDLDSEHAYFLAGAEGIPPGFPLSLGSSTVHSYVIYGRCENDGAVTIKIGYRKAF